MSGLTGRVKGWIPEVLALSGGILFVFSLSPFNFWPLALVSPALLYVSVSSGTLKQTVARFYLFNVGMFGAGVFWIYVPIHVYGYTPAWLALLITVLTVISYSLICLPQAWLFNRFCRSSAISMLAGFSALWVLQEWLRLWFLTGFPWLYLGYGVMGSGLESAAPVSGVLGVSLIAVALSVCLAEAIRKQVLWPGLIAGPLLVLVLILNFTDWTKPDRLVAVSLVQGNIDQHEKWRPENREKIFELYAEASAGEWGREIVIWPEAALTMLKSQAARHLDALDRHARSTGSTLILGIPDRDAEGRFFNKIIALGAGDGEYIKRRLVPFGEYVPLESMLRGIIRFLDLPMSSSSVGPAEQDPLQAGNLIVSSSICYEVVFPDLVRNAVEAPDILVTISNDTWFGESIGPWQHLQMARMRALENGRPMARATNNGLTVLVDHRGEVTASLPQFQQGVLRGNIQLREGMTPFHRLGHWPVLLIAIILFLAAALRVYFRVE